MRSDRHRQRHGDQGAGRGVLDAVQFGERHQRRCGTAEAVEGGHELWHVGHLDPYRQDRTDGTADDQPGDDRAVRDDLLVEQGKIRSWGVSNFDADELERAFYGQASVDEVQKTILIALALVVLVVLVFLKSLRATVIPVIAIFLLAALVAILWSAMYGFALDKIATYLII